MLRVLSMLLLAGLLGGCTSGEAEAPTRPAALAEAGTLDFAEIDVPAAPGASLPNLAVGPGGEVVMSWVEPGADEGTTALRFARLDGDAWTAPRTIAEGADWFVNWADFPSVLPLGDDRLAAHFLEKSSDISPYAYDVRITQSDDGGVTWSAPVTPHRDGTPTEHGFVSLLPGPDGRLLAIWLDGRHTGGGHGHGDGHGGAMTLRTATLGPDGHLADEAQLDERICDCCQTSAARTAHGVVAAYRDRVGEGPEVRDIASVRYDGTAWTAPQPVYDDGWELNGCPVNGPAVAADGDRVAVAWFTAADETPRVRLAFSDDGGATFGSPIGLDDGNPIGRTDVMLLDDGSALVSWIERTDDGAAIRLRRAHADGTAGPAQTLAPTSPERASGFPHLARHGDRLVAAWTETGEPSRIHVAISQ